MKLEWQTHGLATLSQAKGEHGEFKMDAGPKAVRLYFEEQFLGIWHYSGTISKDNAIRLAKIRAQGKENSGETKEWI